MTHPTQEDDVKAIRDALALGPTPGPWGLGNADGFAAIVRNEAGDIITPTGPRTADATYIAACYPERIARLLARLEQAERDAGRWQEVIRHVGADRQCGGFRFTLYTLPPVRGTNPMQGAVCQHFTAAIDAHIAAIASEAKT